jgi:uncharacterized LabA/DUF88 family protein
MIHYKDQRVGVFIDVQNMYYSARHLFQRKVNFPNVVKEAVGERRLIRAIAYVVRTKTGEESAFIDALQKNGIETREKELQEFFSGQKKADWDVGITIDIVRMLDMLDVVVLVSGDGDFVPLVQFIQSRGRQVEVMSFLESTSSKLLDAAEWHTNFSLEKKKFLIGAALPDREGERKPAGEMLHLNGGGSFEEPVQISSEDAQEENRGRRLSF